jgi:hypothetical protein
LPQHVAKVEPPPVKPSCSKTVVHFDVAQNESVTVEETVVAGALCHNSFIARGSTQFTSASISSQASHGILTQTGAIEFEYSPHKRFKGSDQYAVEICGENNAGSGCATINYDVTVE